MKKLIKHPLVQKLFSILDFILFLGMIVVIFVSAIYMVKSYVPLWAQYHSLEPMNARDVFFGFSWLMLLVGTLYYHDTIITKGIFPTDDYKDSNPISIFKIVLGLFVVGMLLVWMKQVMHINIFFSWF